MKFNLKSKLGFTLIELLVVIGILAVLAAIAIPSVAGLIDRANVSADATNANEMTNAVERFTSEYELYCQDLASGRVKAGDLDSAQGRVFNVTGADSREDIELLESTGLNGKQINRDTKYPTNATTMQSLVENYMKTSSTTFAPKQSDCHYYYSPDCGLVVCTETVKSDVMSLNALVQSGKDAKGNPLGAETQWIDLTTEENNVSSYQPAANDGKLERGIGDPDLNHSGKMLGELLADKEYYVGDEFPSIDVCVWYYYNNFEYYFDGTTWCIYNYYGSIYDFLPLLNTTLESINNIPVSSMRDNVFFIELNETIRIPQNITSLYCSFNEISGSGTLEIPCHISDTDVNSWINVECNIQKYHYDGCGH